MCVCVHVCVRGGHFTCTMSLSVGALKSLSMEEQLVRHGTPAPTNCVHAYSCNEAKVPSSQFHHMTKTYVADHPVPLTFFCIDLLGS